MNLSRVYSLSAYAALKQGISVKDVIERLRVIMSRRGHERLLSKTLTLLEAEFKKEDQERTVGIISSKKINEKTVLAPFGDVLPKDPIVTASLNPDLIGGLVIKTSQVLIDRSYRTALSSLYQKMIS